MKFGYKKKFINYINSMLFGTTQELLGDKRFIISDDFFRRILSFRDFECYKIDYIELGKITYKNTPLQETVPYQYLEGDLEGYKRYCAYHRERLHIDMSVQRYDELIKNINENGYDERYIIVLRYDNSLMDGQHRACCLMYKYGENYKVKVLKIKLKKRSILQKISRYFARARRCDN